MSRALCKDLYGRLTPLASLRRAAAALFSARLVLLGSLFSRSDLRPGADRFRFYRALVNYVCTALLVYTSPRPSLAALTESPIRLLPVRHDQACQRAWRVVRTLLRMVSYDCGSSSSKLGRVEKRAATVSQVDFLKLTRFRFLAPQVLSYAQDVHSHPRPHRRRLARRHGRRLSSREPGELLLLLLFASLQLTDLFPVNSTPPLTARPRPSTTLILLYVSSTTALFSAWPR